MRYARQAAAASVALGLCLAGGSAVNAVRPATAMPVPAPMSPVTAAPAAAGTTPSPAARPIAPPPPGPPQPQNAPVPAAPAPGVASMVGALFTIGPNGLEDHFCTASVVHSPRRNLVITAAHCLHSGADGGYLSNVVFVPGYHDGVTPYGIWTADRMTVDPRWIGSSDEDLDVGFLTVSQAGNPRPIEDVTGSNDFTTDRGFNLPVTVIGYPSDTDEPVTCSNTSTQQSRYQLRLDCAGFVPGTSGGPFLIGINPRTRRGSVAGVIGGYQQGGYDSDVSYTSYFDSDVANLYRVATQTG